MKWRGDKEAIVKTTACGYKVAGFAEDKIDASITNSDVWLVGDPKMREGNRRYRGSNQTTDKRLSIFLLWVSASMFLSPENIRAHCESWKFCDALVIVQY